MPPLPSPPRWYAPPRLNWGTQTVKVIVGTTQKEYVVHKRLLCVASKFFERALNGQLAASLSQEVKLPEDDPVLFACVYDWLYFGLVQRVDSLAFIHARSLWYDDHVWLQIYRMADRMMMPGLKALAFKSAATSFGNHLAYIPSREFLKSLFEDEAPLALRMYVVEHVAYWLPKSANKDQWGSLFMVHDRFGAEMALAMLRSQAEGNLFQHPADQVDFLKNHGFDLDELRQEARAADDEIGAQPLKHRDQAVLSTESEASRGSQFGSNKRPASQTFESPLPGFRIGGRVATSTEPASVAPNASPFAVNSAAFAFGARSEVKLEGRDSAATATNPPPPASRPSASLFASSSVPAFLPPATSTIPTVLSSQRS
ncbi:hypothetical protein LTR41_005466 [Exophiala xenobiotica]|nr:hypothetical protein LTR41_005466 [Exophiala xenobiotica]